MRAQARDRRVCGPYYGKVCIYIHTHLATYGIRVISIFHEIASTFHSPDPRPISYVCRLDHAIRGAPSVQNAARCSPSDNELCRAVARASWQGFGSRYHKRTAFKFNSKARGAGNFPAVSFMNS